MNWKLMSTLVMLVLVGLTRACNKEDCETGISVARGALIACAGLGAIACAATAGIACPIIVGCSVANGLGFAASQACRACGTDEGGDNEFTSSDRQTLQEILNRSENSFNGQDRDNLQEILDRAVEGYNNEDRETLEEILKLSKDGFNNNDRRIVQELLARAELDSVKLGEIQKQVNDIPRQINELEEKIDVTQIIALYGDDLSNYYKIRQYFNNLQVTDGGRIKRDRHSETFFKQAHDIKDIFIISTNIYRMITGGHFLKSEGLFEAIPDSCNSVNYIVAIMSDCWYMYNTALAMKGYDILPAQIETFKNQMIGIQNQYIQDCGCPSGKFKKTRRDLTAMVEFDTAKKPASQFYHEISLDPSVDKLTLKKMSLVYSVKPFDNTEEAKEIFTYVDIENAQLVNTLGVDHLEELHRYEGSFYCRKAPRLAAIGGFDNHLKATSSVEILGGSCNIDIDLPEGRHGHIAVTTLDRKLLVCGGYTTVNPHGFASCLEFNYNTNSWMDHSSLLQARYGASAVQMPAGLYVVGCGNICDAHKSTSEYLPNGSTQWTQGPNIPGEGVGLSCIVVVSDTEFVVLGGVYDGTQARVFNVNTQTWRDWPRLTQAVYAHSCVKINDDILIVGGKDQNGQDTDRTVVINSKTGVAKDGSPLRYPRAGAAMMVYGEDRVLIMGGYVIKSKSSHSEIWSPNNRTWEEADISLNINRGEFALVAMADNIDC